MTRSELMKRVRLKDTEAELALRSALFRRGMRFRVHRKLEGVTADIIFVSARVAVFVDGCFWHGCPTHATFPKTNQDYWLPKLAENRERDRRQTDKLSAAGWRVIRIWEHDCLPPADDAVRSIVESVRQREQTTGGRADDR